LRRRAIHAAAPLSVWLALASATAVTSASAQPLAAPPQVLQELAPGLRAAGAGRLRWFGLDLYEARLWTEPGFRAGSALRHRLMLELTYRRAFRSADIARRSLAEMERAAPLAVDDAARWSAELRRVLPDVQPGDRVSGVHLPDRGAIFFVNGQLAGRIDDGRFSERFFGIWLAATTSEPALRAALLAGSPP